MEKKLSRYIVPNILAMTGISCYVLADTFFIAKAEGTNGITALNLALPVYGIIFAVGSMVGVGSATRYTLNKALGDKDADSYFSNSIICTLIFSIMFAAVGFIFSGDILTLMGADDVIRSTGLSYMKTVMCFAPFFMLNYTFTSFVRNDGQPNIAMTATLISGGFNIVFDYVFMFPMGMGMTGAALATGLSPVVSMLICMIHYLSHKNTIRFRLQMPSLRQLFSACSLGIVAFVGEISSGITTMVFNFILLDLAGNIAVAAYGVIANASLVGMALFNGVSQGLQPPASEMHGRGMAEEERRIYKHSLQTGVGIAVVLVVLAWLFADVIVSIFNSEGSLLMAQYAERGTRIYSLGFLIASVNIIRAGFYSATGQAAVSSFISVLRGFAAITIFAFLLSRLWGITGVWLAFPVAEIFTLMVSMLFFKGRKIAEKV